MADIIKTATRDAYGKALIELGHKDKNVIVMDSDLAEATRTGKFKKEFPDRFFDSGIAECDMMCIAAGLAATGHTVFASSFAMFAAGRAFEQIRNSIAYPNLNVKIGATHAGISVGEDGASHQCCEDIALMRSIPNMVILNPADDVEARLCVLAAAEHDGPVYMRFGRLAVPRVFDDNYNFEIGKGNVLIAAENLKADGISARVVNMATIKPIDSDIIVDSVKKTGAVVTAEEHNIIGGLGSAVTEVVCEKCPAPVLRVGVEDVFGRSGPAVELLHIYGLDAAHIEEKAKEAIKLK